MFLDYYGFNDIVMAVQLGILSYMHHARVSKVFGLQVLDKMRSAPSPSSSTEVQVTQI